MKAKDDDSAIFVVPLDSDLTDRHGTPCAFWYLGASYAKYLAVTEAVPAAWRVVDVGDMVNDAAARLSPLLAQLDDHVFSGRPPLDWWAGHAAERNPYASDFYLSLSQAVALVEAAREGGLHVVAVDDPSLGRALVETLRRAGLKAHWRGPRESALSRPWDRAKAVASALRDAWRGHRAMRRFALVPQNLAGQRLWVLSWVRADSFPAGAPATKDHFFGALPLWLIEWRVRWGWLANPTGWLGDSASIAAAVARASEPATLIASFIPWRARLGAAWRVFAPLLSCKLAIHALGVDLSAMIRRATDQDLALGIVARTRPFREVARQCRKLGVEPETLLYTYENQPWEKQLLAGFRQHLPATRLVGFQHTIFADRYISALPTKAQLEAGLFPDLLLVSGEEFRDRLIEQGVPAERLAICGALRFPDLADLGAEATRPPQAVATVLATLPMQGDEALELAHKAALAIGGLDGMRLLINFHPMMNKAARKSIEERIAALDLGDKIRLVDGAARHWLEECDLLLYNSSGTVFEAARIGRPAIYVGPSTGLDLEKLPGGSSLRCRSPQELASLLSALRNDPQAIAAAIQDMRTKTVKCFSPPHKEMWREVLDLDAACPDGVKRAGSRVTP